MPQRGQTPLQHELPPGLYPRHNPERVKGRCSGWRLAGEKGAPSCFELKSRNQSLVKLVGRPVPRLPASTPSLRRVLGGRLWFPPDLKAFPQVLPRRGLSGTSSSLGQVLQTHHNLKCLHPRLPRLEAVLKDLEILPSAMDYMAHSRTEEIQRWGWGRGWALGRGKAYNSPILGTPSKLYSKF